MSADAPAAARPRPHWLVWLFAGVGLLGLLSFIALAALVFGTEDHREEAKVAGAKQETTFAVGAPEALTGTNLMNLAVYASQGGRIGSGPYSGSRDDQRNVLLVDKETGASRRILPNNDRRIASVRFLPAKAQVQDSAPGDAAALQGPQPKTDPAAYYLLVLDQGGSSDTQDVLVGTLAGGRQGVVMQGLDGVDSVWMKSATQIGLLVRERLALYYRVVDIPTLKVVQSQRIAID